MRKIDGDELIKHLRVAAKVADKNGNKYADNHNETLAATCFGNAEAYNNLIISIENGVYDVKGD